MVTGESLVENARFRSLVSLSPVSCDGLSLVVKVSWKMFVLGLNCHFW